MSESGNSRHLALDEYTKFIPPGWEPHLSWYSLKNYRDNLELWGHLIAEDDGTTPPMNTVGPLVIGRLKGAAKRLAMKISMEYPQEPHSLIPANKRGTTITGIAAIVHERIPEEYDPNTGVMICRGMPSGLQLLLQQFDDAYGKDDQDISGEALDRFDSCVRGNNSLMD